MEPLVGVAPTRSLYKKNPQAAAERQRWSQSPVLPRTRLAYDACLNAGSTAAVPKLEPLPGDFNCTDDTVKIRRDPHLSHAFFRPHRHGEIPVFWNATPFANTPIRGERIRGIFRELLRG